MYRDFPILIVDDDPNDRLLLQRAFMKAEINAPLYFAEDGETAEDYLGGVGRYSDRAQFPLPKLVLLDIKMPRVSGLEVLSWLREQAGLKRMPVVMLTSSAHQGDVDQAHEMCANAYVVKPNSPEELIVVVRAIATFWLQQEKFPRLSVS